MGYDVHHFKSRLPNEVICRICFGVLETPMEIVECGHMFCRHCIEKWIEVPYYNSATCPACRIDITLNDAQQAPVLIKKYLEKLKVKCVFSDCIADVTLGEFNRHYSQCPLNPQKPIACNRGCGVRLPPEEMLKHCCSLDMCQDAIEWEEIFQYVRREIKRKSFKRFQHRPNILNESCKSLFNFFTNWMADPRLQTARGEISHH